MHSLVKSDRVRVSYFAKLTTDLGRKVLITTDIVYRSHISFEPLAQTDCVVTIQGLLFLQ